MINKTWQSVFVFFLLLTMVGTTYLYNITMPVLMVFAIAYLTKGSRVVKQQNSNNGNTGNQS